MILSVIYRTYITILNGIFYSLDFSTILMAWVTPQPLPGEKSWASTQKKTWKRNNGTTVFDKELQRRIMINLISVNTKVRLKLQIDLECGRNSTFKQVCLTFCYVPYNRCFLIEAKTPMITKFVCKSMTIDFKEIWAASIISDSVSSFQMFRNFSRAQCTVSWVMRTVSTNCSGTTSLIYGSFEQVLLGYCW